MRIVKDTEPWMEAFFSYVTRRPDQFRETAKHLTADPDAKVPDPFQMRREREELFNENHDLKMRVARLEGEREDALKHAVKISNAHPWPMNSALEDAWTDLCVAMGWDL